MQISLNSSGASVVHWMIMFLHVDEHLHMPSPLKYNMCINIDQPQSRQIKHKITSGYAMSFPLWITSHLLKALPGFNNNTITQ